MEDRLDLEHGAHHGGGGGHPAALFQEEQVVDGEVVALAQLIGLGPVPDLLHCPALLAQLGGLVYQHPLAQGGAQGVHHNNFALRELLRQLLGGDLEGVAGGGQPGGKGQHQRVLSLLEHRLQGVGGLPHVDGVGGGHQTLPLLAIKFIRGHIPVIRPISVGFAVHDEGQGEYGQLQLLN